MTENWEQKPIVDICLKVSSGGTPSRKNDDYYSKDKSGHLWVKSKELLEKGISNTEERITDEGLQNSSAKYYPEGTVLLAMYGANIGQLAWLEEPATVNQAICAMVIDPEKANNKYVYYSLLETREKLKVQAQGAAQQNLNSGQIKAFKIPYPPLPTQQKIASILSTYDDLIENNNRRISILEEMAQKLYREWFVKFRFPGHEEVKMVDSELGEIPEGWDVVVFTQIANVLSGGTPKTKVDVYWNGDIPFFAPKDAPSNFFTIETEKSITELGLSKCNSKLYQKNTVFITARGTVGKVVMLAIDMAMNQSCYALKGEEDIGQYFLFLLTKKQVDYLKKNTGGATFDTIVVDTFDRMKVIKPIKGIIHKFEHLVEPFFDQTLNLIKRNKNLKQQRDLLLPKLISGKIQITEMENI